MRKPYNYKIKSLILMALLLLCVVAFMGSLRTCSGDRTEPLFGNEAAHKSGGDTIDIAIELSSTCYSVHLDSIGGNDYLLLKMISDSTGIPMKFHPFVPIQYALSGLKDGKFDMVVASVPVSSTMKEEFLVTEPIKLDHQVLVQPVDSMGRKSIAQLQDLGGKEVWIMDVAPYLERIINLSHEIGDTIVVRTAPQYTPEQLVILTATGHLPLCVVNREVAETLGSEFDNINYDLDVSLSQFHSWLLPKKHVALCDSMNVWIKKYNNK